MFMPAALVANRLGLPKTWLLSEANARRIPHLKIGQRVMFNPALVERVLLGRAAETASAERGAIEIHVHKENVIIATAPHSTAVGKIVRSNGSCGKGEHWLVKMIIAAIVRSIEAILTLFMIWYSKGG